MMKLWSDYLDGLKAGAQILPFTKKAGKPNSKTMEQFDQIQKLLNDDIRVQCGAVQFAIICNCLRFLDGGLAGQRKKQPSQRCLDR